MVLLWRLATVQYGHYFTIFGIFRIELWKAGIPYNREPEICGAQFGKAGDNDTFGYMTTN